MIDLAKHDLDKLTTISQTRVNYICRCGREGYATVSPQLVDVLSVDDRAKKNHMAHAVRALVKER